MKIIGGVYQADAGSLIVDDVPCTFRSPSEALDKGIRVVFQELSVLENLDISENIFLGRELRKAGARHLYLSNLPIQGTRQTLERILALV
jgi:ABC-type sugar transport system ATPase subunit